ncbi:MAG: hemolysin III family protein [Gammaproteobacteria bacterium]|nr:hemolysin III family protein [Gammaproteobacteria bacterium]
MYKGERFNSISHLIGAAAATAGLAVLVVLAARQGDPWKVVSFSLYGTTLLLLYIFSTLYHSLQGKAKNVFLKLDHHAIYLLIAGTYTPFTLVTLRGGWGWSLFGVIWGLAILGIVLDSLPRKGRRILPVVIYLAMGWLALIALNPLLQALPLQGIVWLVAGGLFYTAGIGFYAVADSLRHAHAIWHLFVLTGSVTHYLAVVLYVA